LVRSSTRAATGSPLSLACSATTANRLPP
jgi:hypothetical protein